MAKLVTVANVQDLAVGDGKVLQVRNLEIALFNVDGAFYALENTCCHRGGPLGDGAIKGNSVTCPWHMWEFELATGACVNSPGDRVRTYDVVVEDDQVKVRL
ncbi:MAG: Rieske 2Fe-2S domain-containing protein [Acidobacteria bacterium]|nr:Rieske 2Fe-2S domain-containing protein [Acidobacteriota bacterium]